ncbi:hypothetical protein [Shimia ponticola]|uniref:hypothetical protein n=1 Tax=Shimia ponticola TaxID=2582893 RepID=UPI00164BEEE1|nr:hypothetical protein [Shimia ponticola]
MRDGSAARTGRTTVSDKPEAVDARRAAIDTYLELTRTTLPAAATSRGNWPIRNDHCFQRVILDQICAGVWYDHIPRPAYRHMTQEQTEHAAALAQAILDGTADLGALNRQSIAWRKARNTSAPCPSEPRQKMLDL